MAQAVDRYQKEASRLRRVRIDDEPAQGAKRVWHSSGTGIDLLTDVDAEGRATFQEFAFPRHLVRWQAGGAGVSTGRELQRPSKPGRDTGFDLLLDAQPDAGILDEAIALLCSAPADRYIKHLLDAVRAARDAAIHDVDSTVTGMRRIETRASPTAAKQLSTKGFWRRLMARLRG